MLSNKQIRMLELLDEIMYNCRNCELYNGGHVTPYWTPFSRYVIIGEAPGAEEVEKNEPFIGKAGKILWNIMDNNNLRKEEFLIVNSVNCRPTDGKKNLKPNVDQINICKKNWLKYIKVSEPEKMLILGNYANGSISGKYDGIVSINSSSYSYYYLDKESGRNKTIEYIASVHPSYCIYNHEEGYKLLSRSILNFKRCD